MDEQITLRRTWSKMPLWHKTKLMYSLMFQSIFLPSSSRLNEMVCASFSYKLNEGIFVKCSSYVYVFIYICCYQLKELDDVDMLTLVIQEMSKEYPTLMETLVHERDRLVSSLLEYHCFYNIYKIFT